MRRPRELIRSGLAPALLSLLIAGGAAAQNAPAMQNGIATIQQEQLFARTLYGRAVQDRLKAATRQLEEENRRIEADLEAEERQLTDLRPTLPPAEFRQRADAFNTKVEGIRSAQEAKARALSEQQDADRKAFFQTAIPILTALMRETGAAALLDQSTVILSLDAIDLTDRAVARIDADLGAGPVPADAPAKP